MAARKIALGLNQEWRNKIQASMLVNCLNDHIFKSKNLEKTQIKAIEILLRKVAPDLSQVDANLHVKEIPQARVFPLGISDEHDRLPPASETVDRVH